MLVVHDWLKDYIGDDIPDAQAVADMLTFHAFEIEGVEEKGSHQVIDIDVLPNRGADCLSHRGIAKEVATLLDRPLQKDPFAEQPEMPLTEKLKITIGNENACRHFDLALITGVKVGESPQWLRERLEALGQRSINNIVDATNYVMFGLGQPTHVYDADKFKPEGNTWHFGVRMAKGEGKVKTLGGEEYEIDETVQLIVNEADGAIAGIAGIKGGAYAELTPETTTIIVEAGNFDASITRKAAQKLRLKTDASRRFENGVSTNIVPYAISEVVALILELAGGTLEGYAHARPVDVVNPTVSVTLEHINTLLGLSLDEKTVEDIFERLNLMVTKSESGAWKVVAPFERTDINIAEDIIEEVGRIYGYDKVESVVPEAVLLCEYNKRHYYSERIREVLVGEGFSEVITSSFRKKDDIQLQNALASDKSCLRSRLSKNIAETLTKNAGFADLLGTTDTRVFEIGTVFSLKHHDVVEHTSLAFGVQIKAGGYSGKEDKVINDVLVKLSEALNADLDAHVEKGIAEMDLTKLLEQLPDVAAYEPVAVSEDVVYQPFSLMPSVSRDIALWVPEGTTATDVETILNESAGELRVRTTLFDEFTKDGRTSYAFRLVFQSDKRTLTDVEVNSFMEAVYEAVKAKGFEVR